MGIRMKLESTGAFICALLVTTTAHADLTVSTNATQGVSCASGVCKATAKVAVLNVNDLANLLVASNVTIHPGKKAKNIVFAAPLAWTSDYGLALDSYESISIDSPIADSGAGSLALTYNDGGSGGGNLSFFNANITFASLSNALTINGNAYTLVGNVSSLAAGVAANPSGYFALAQSYDVGQDGTYSSAPVGTQLYGIFEGLGNTFSNLQVSEANDGLFASSDGSIRDIGLLNAQVSCTTTSNEAHGSAAGALVGDNAGAIWRSYATGAVSATFDSYIGGLVGRNRSQDAIITSSFADVSVSDTRYGGDDGGSEMGGLAGLNEENAQVVQSYATGSVTANGAYETIGGLVGFDDEHGFISQAYATGAVSVPDGSTLSDIGGLTGASDDGNFADSYSTGPVTVSGADCTGYDPCAGGLLGWDGTGGRELAHSYWDTDTSGITNSNQGTGNISHEHGITGMTTAQFQAGLPKGFNAKIWKENAAINNGLPYLIANPPQ